jgi:dCTP deaminase
MILSAQSIRERSTLITPFFERTVVDGMSYGLSACGYDVRIAQSIHVRSGWFTLASTIERFCMPLDLVGRVHDKSTLARKGLAVQNTIIEPGWNGYLTLELTNHGHSLIWLPQGTPIAQIIFELLDKPTEQPYEGKYQNQPDFPVGPILEKAKKVH